MADDTSSTYGDQSDPPSAPTTAQQPERQRARPQYGEYASPQDQANAIATSLPPVSPALRAPAHHSVAPAPDPTTRADDHPEASANHTNPTNPTNPTNSGNPTNAARQTSATRSPTTTTPHRWDLVLSIGLLVYGFLNVISGLFQYADLGGYLDEFYRTLGIGDYAGTASDRPIGIAIAASNVVSFALAAWFTARRLRTGKITFWIPLVSGVVAAIVSSVLLVILLTNDPTMTSYVNGLLKK